MEQLGMREPGILSKPILQLRDLSYGPTPARVLTEGLSLCLASGEFLWISGPNGCGKSTLLRLLIGSIPGQSAPHVHSGAVIRDVAPSKIGMLPQLQNADFHIPLLLEDVISSGIGRRLVSRDLDSLPLLSGLDLSTPWSEASGGERKRTLLARVLLKDPELLILDEPMNHLDERGKAQVLETIRLYLEMASDVRPRTAVVVSHGILDLSRFNPTQVRQLRLGAGGVDA